MAFRVCPCVSVGVRQHTQDVRSSSWQSVITHRTSVCVSQHRQDARVYACVSVSTHRTSVGVLQHTQDVRGCPSVHISARWPFPCTVRVILDHVGCLFSTHRTSVGVRQRTQDVYGCPSAHTGHLLLSMCVCQHTHDVRGCSVHISARWFLDSAHWPFPWTVRVILAHVGCLFGTHRTSVGVCQHTQDVRVCPSGLT